MEKRRGLDPVPFTDRAKKKLEALLSSLLRKRRESQPQTSFQEDDPQKLRNSKLILQRCGNPATEYAFILLTEKGLKSRNSHSRLTALTIIQELVPKSSHLRKLLFAGDLQSFIKHIMYLQGLSNLPEPETAAKELHAKALLLVTTWQKEYGSFYPRLNIAMKFLNSYLPSLEESSNLALSKRERDAQERERRTQKILKARFENICSELLIGEEETEVLQDIRLCLDEIEGHLEFLLPNLFKKNSKPQLSEHNDVESDIIWDSEDTNETENNSTGEVNVSHLPQNYELVLEISKGDMTTPKIFEGHTLSVSPAAKDLISDSLLDRLVEAKRTHLPKILYWVKVLSKVELSNSHFRLKRNHLLSLTLQIKSRLLTLEKKCKSMGLKVDLDNQTLSSKKASNALAPNEHKAQFQTQSRSINSQFASRSHSGKVHRKSRKVKKRKHHESFEQKKTAFNPFAKRR